MKKHLKVILIILSVLAVCGVGLWFVFVRAKTETLPNTVNAFINSDSTQELQSRLESSQKLYSKHYADTRLTIMRNIIIKVDEFEQDLNSYLILCDASARSTKDLTESYNKLTNSRTTLIKDCDEFIVRLKGNTLAQGQTIKVLYDSLFDKTSNHLSEYISCFARTSNYIFTNVTSSSNIKLHLYNLYSCGISDLVDNITNHQFKDSSIAAVNILNRTITLDEKSNIILKDNEDMIGGEFSTLALDFKKYYNLSDKHILISNFSEYYNLQSIDPNTETSKEKLAVYYFKKIVKGV